MSVLAELEPRVIMDFFDVLTRIPRGSENEKGVSDWVVQFAKDRGLEYHQDDLYCVLVRKPGTAGYEDAPTVILHGHLDMVCAKDDGVEFDFLTEPLKLLRDGDYVTADGTSLGADNGIGVSYILALLDSTDIPHPPLEAVLTSMEEKGKVGGANFDTTLLRGTRMIDFNWITDKEILAGCGGDVSATIDIPAEWESTDDPNLTARTLQVHGLNGGHCEFDIHLERINAIILLARALNAMLAQGFDLRIDAPHGGAQNNVIAADAEVTVVLPAADADALEVAIKDVVETVASEYDIADPNVRIDLVPTDLPERVFSREATRRLTRSIVLLPNGVVSWSLQGARHRRVLVQPRHGAPDRGGLPADGHHHLRGDLAQARRARPDAGAGRARRQRGRHRAVRPRRPRVPLRGGLRAAARWPRSPTGSPTVRSRTSRCRTAAWSWACSAAGCRAWTPSASAPSCTGCTRQAEKFSISSVQGTWKFITTLMPTLR